MDGGRYQLISGHRRTRAARLLGWAHIDAILISKDEFQTKATTFFSNEGHVGLTEYERALMFQASLTEKVVADQEALAKRTGLSSGRISQIMSMLEFPAAFINLLDTYPGLFGYRIGAEIRKLLKAHPAAADTILQGVERLIDDPKLSEVDLREFVARKLKTKVARRQPPLPVQDAKGKPIFTVEVTEKRITIDIKEAVDVEKLGKRTLASLREFVATLNVTDEK
jgi:ParB family chromosome partitioning protein